MNEEISNLKDKIKKCEKNEDKYKTELKKIKSEQKSHIKTHSYISALKPAYGSSKAPLEELKKTEDLKKSVVEDLNKENVGQQQQ